MTKVYVYRCPKGCGVSASPIKSKVQETRNSHKKATGHWAHITLEDIEVLEND